MPPPKKKFKELPKLFQNYFVKPNEQSGIAENTISSQVDNENLIENPRVSNSEIFENEQEIDIENSVSNETNNVNDPWSADNLDEFLYYCCPECNVKNRTKEEFVTHALNHHPNAKDFLKKINQNQNQISVNDSQEINDQSEKQKPFHPASNFQFPKRPFGKEKNLRMRSANSSWFDTYKWLDYDVEKDAVFCFYCKKNSQENSLKNTKEKDAFISKGFVNWKDAIEKFKNHQSSKSHEIAVSQFDALSQHKDVAEILLTTHANEKRENRKMVKKILQTLQVLLHQGLAIRAHDDETSNLISADPHQSKSF